MKRVRILGNKIIISLLIVGTLTGVGLGFKYLHDRDSRNTAEQAVYLMYNFESFSDVYENQMKDLEKICSEDVYKNITVKNIDRALTTYLKFKGNPCKVNILQKSNNYIIYELDTPSITAGRKFVMFYETNIWGKIVKMEEAELRDFYKARS